MWTLVISQDSMPYWINVVQWHALTMLLFWHRSVSDWSTSLVPVRSQTKPMRSCYLISSIILKLVSSEPRTASSTPPLTARDTSTVTRRPTKNLRPMPDPSTSALTTPSATPGRLSEKSQNLAECVWKSGSRVRRRRTLPCKTPMWRRPLRRIQTRWQKHIGQIVPPIISTTLPRIQRHHHPPAARIKSLHQAKIHLTPYPLSSRSPNDASTLLST